MYFIHAPIVRAENPIQICPCKDLDIRARTLRRTGVPEVHGFHSLGLKFPRSPLFDQVDYFRVGPSFVSDLWLSGGLAVGRNVQVIASR
jgi:hypothetical protein